MLMKFATLRFSYWMVSLIIGLSKSAIAEDLSPELGELLEKGLRSKGPVQLEQFLNLDPIQEFCSDPNANIHGD